jgi:hypothetical protein
MLLSSEGAASANARAADAEAVDFIVDADAVLVPKPSATRDSRIATGSRIRLVSFP